MRVIPQIIGTFLLLAACETTSPPPYSPSTANVIAMQQATEDGGERIRLGEFTTSPDVDSTPMCRGLGPLDVAPGQDIGAYVKDAFLQELFMAQAYGANSAVTVSGNIDRVAVSTLTTGSWVIAFTVTSSNGVSYSVETNYSFSSSFNAVTACQSAANVFSLAVRDLIARTVAHPQYRALVGR